MRLRVALVLVLTAVALSAQEKPVIPTLGETIEVSIVNVDVVVTDKKGNRVRGLTKNDFEILESKKLQAITNFAEYSSAIQASSAGTETSKESAPLPRQPRTIVVFVEQMHLEESQAKAMVGAIRELLSKSVENGDAVSVVLWNTRGDLQLRYTGDPDEIDEALDHVLELITGRMPDSLRNMREDLESTRKWIGDLAKLDRPRNPVLEASAAAEDERNNTVQGEAVQALAEIRKRVQTINSVIDGMAARDGKKILLLATRRLGRVAGAEFFFAAGSVTLEGPTVQKFGTEQLMKTIVANANAAGVTIYPIFAPVTAQDVRGASSNTVENHELDNLVGMNEMASLTDIAVGTGGLAASNVPEIVALLPRVEDDLTDYYSLAYRASGSRADRTRAVVVRAKNPDYVVRARREHVEKTDATRMKDRVVAKLVRDFDEAAFQLSGNLGAPMKQGKSDIVALKLRIPIKDLTMLPANRKNTGSYSVFVASADSAGNISGVVQQTHSYEIKDEDLDRAMEGVLTFSCELAVSPKADRVAVGVLDEVSKTWGLLRLPIDRR
jgi:VWFA-related protein